MAAADSKHDQHILEAIASGRRVTQRGLAGDLGVAVGLANLLVRRLVGKGYIKVAGMGTRHVRYLMTPAGLDALARATRLSLENTVRLYTHTREQIRATLVSVSERCQPLPDGRKPILFYGAGDVAEIAYISLQTTDLTLVAVVDDYREGRFFDLPIHRAESLRPAAVAGIEYAHIVVTSVRHADVLAARLDACGIPPTHVSRL